MGLIPLSDASRRPNRMPVVTASIIAVNVFVFLLELTGGDAFVTKWALIPANIVAGRHLVTILTSMFMHASWSHIIGNMVFLWAFGPEIEDLMDRPRYLVFYLLGGLAATAAQVALGPTSTVPNLGASGAIAAVMGAFIVTYPRDRIRSLLVIFVFVREPPGLRHGRIAMEIAGALGAHVRAQQHGRVYVESGFKLTSNPDTVRGPDVAFISQSRLPEPEPVGYPALAPDLVVEILSPGDRPGEVLGKVADWLSAGTRLVWVMDPERRLARVYRADGAEAIVTADQALQGEDVVPGFVCPLATIL